MTRRPVALLAAIALAAVAVLFVIVTRPAEEAAPGAPPASDMSLLLLVVRSDTGPFAAVLGTTGGPQGALVLPTEISITVPGQGDARLDEALDLPLADATTTVANVLGLPVEHVAILGRLRLAAIVDRAGGLDVGGGTRSGGEVVAMLEDAGRGRTAAFRNVLEALLRADVRLEPADLAETDDERFALDTFGEATAAPVVVLERIEPAEGIFRVEPDAVRAGIVDAFGGPARDLVGVIVLNGSGVPGVGEAIARRIVGDGFSVVVSENASDFDHEQTLVVVGNSSDVALGQRVRDLLGVGSVNVSVSSGLAPVTIVVGKDFSG